MRIFVLEKVESYFEGGENQQCLKAFRSKSVAMELQSKYHNLYERYLEACRAGRKAREYYYSIHPVVRPAKPHKPGGMSEKDFYRNLYLPWLEKDEPFEEQQKLIYTAAEEEYEKVFHLAMKLVDNEVDLFKSLNLDQYAERISFQISEIELE